MPKVMNLERLLCANGAGSGAAMCRAMGTFTLACDFHHPDKLPATKAGAFVGNVAEGPSSDLPAIFGPTSVQARRTVLILE
eukprot:929518-Pyramimonas_sp.AAC.1